MNENQQLEVLPPTVNVPLTREIQPQSALANAGPLSVSQVKAGLQAIHEVMRDCMTDGQDYGKVPGCGDKPGLFQPGAQKLSMMFQLNPAVAQETVTDYQNFHRGYRLVVRVTAGSKFAEGVGECSTMESKYRFRNANRVCPHCGKETVFRSKDKPEFYCWSKKGGCGNVFADGSPMATKISEQAGGKVEHDNPPDFWNTVRKMAFKRAFVHAIINATNTSELWSQDLEDLAANGVVTGEAQKTASTPPPARQTPPPATPTPQARKNVPTVKQELSGDVLTELVCLESFKMVNSKPGAARPWTAWFCNFEREDGTFFEAGTFNEEIAAKLDVFKGVICNLAHRAGKKAGTREIVAVDPQ